MSDSHVVTVLHLPQQTRAVCSCSWASPWATAGPPQPDIPPRTDYVEKAVRAAEWHVRSCRSCESDRRGSI